LARLMRWLHLASIYLVPTTRWGDHLISFLRFVRRNRRLPNQPNGYNDRFYRLKVTDEILNPLRVFVSDKEFVKLFIRGALGEDRSATTYAVLKTPEEIEAYDFPPDCVVKPTHASQRVIFRQHGSDIDREEIKSWLSLDYYRISRQANYKPLQPKVIVEELLFKAVGIPEYKFYCYDGQVRLIQADYNRHSVWRALCFDRDWNWLDFGSWEDINLDEVSRPDPLDDMIRAAEQIGEHFSDIRVDMFALGPDWRIGEITNCTMSGNWSFADPEVEQRLAGLINGEPW